MLTWFSTSNMLSEELISVEQTIKEAAEDFTEVPIENIFLGASFGKFDFVLDCSCLSGKVASHFISIVASKLDAMNFENSYSTSMCKNILPSSEIINLRHEQTEKSIRCYTYLRPAVRSETMTQFFEEKMRGSHIESDANLLWNDSSYPLVLEVSGNKAMGVLKDCRGIIQHLRDSLLESSTFVVLRLGAKDVQGGKLFVVTYVKLRKFPAKLVVPKSERLWPSNIDSLECLGWYDVCTSFTGRSLSEIHEKIFRLRRDNKEHIHQTSTNLMYPSSLQ
jgi:hypothetical protein